MKTKKATYDKLGISTLADNKPVVYRIQTLIGKDNFVGVAKSGRLDQIMEHLGQVPGSVVKIVQYDSLEDARIASQRIINREKPKYNRKEDIGQHRLKAIASQSDYQRKVAEAISKRLVAKSDPRYHETYSIILAVLASEQVVDPADADGWSDAYATAENKIANLERVAKTVAKVQAKIDSGEHVVTTPPASQSAYQEKLTEAMAVAIHAEFPQPKQHLITGIILAILASEGVVDPVEYAEGLVSLSRENKRLEAKVQKMKANLDQEKRHFRMD